MRFLKKGIIGLSLLFTTLAAPTNASARAASSGYHGGHGGSHPTETVAEKLMREAHEAEIRAKLLHIIADPSKGPKDFVSVTDKRYSFFEREDVDYLNEARKEVLGDSSKVPSPAQAESILKMMHAKGAGHRNKTENTIFLSIFATVLGGVAIFGNDGSDKPKKKKYNPRP